MRRSWLSVIGSRSWNVLRSPADALLACDFFETVTLSGARMYVLVVIEHSSRRIRLLGATAHPTTSWVTQTAKNLVMDLEDVGCRARFMIRDRDGKFPGLFDDVRNDAGIRASRTPDRYTTADTNRRSGQAKPPRHTTPRPPWWHPPCIQTCRVTCTDEVFGKRRATDEPGRAGHPHLRRRDRQHTAHGRPREPVHDRLLPRLPVPVRHGRTQVGGACGPDVVGHQGVQPVPGSRRHRHVPPAACSRSRTACSRCAPAGGRRPRWR